jgi:hypothetical protein
MAAVYDWLRQTWSTLVMVADMNEPSTATEPPERGCEIYTDALDQLTNELDDICNRIDFNLDRLWECRQAKAAAFGGIDATRQNMTNQSIAGAKIILRTARNRVHQVIGEIEIVSKPPEAQQQAVTE